MAFTHLLHGVTAHRYGIEINAFRAEQARALGIETLHANTMDVRCPPEAVSLALPESSVRLGIRESNNQRLELVFLEHSYRWLKAEGVLVFVIPQLRLAKCARLLSEHFTDLHVFRLTEPASLEYKQIVVLGTRRKRHSKVSDAVLLDEMEGCRFSIGLRNSHDKSMRLAMTCGYRVFVCSNMAFAGDFTSVLAKHSK